MLFKTAGFTFKPYAHVGFSGRKLLATRKSDGKKFIVKHEEPECACNEFVYFSIAKELGLKVLDFHLFEKDDQLFRHNAIAIEFIEKDNSKMGRIADVKSKIKNSLDYFSHRALEGAFWQGDTFQTIIGNDGYIYRIDPTESFGIDVGTIGWIKHFGSPRIVPRGESIYGYLKTASNGIKEDGCTAFEHNHFLETLACLNKIPVKKIEAIVNEVCKLYAPGLKEVYMSFFADFKKAYKRFQDGIVANYDFG